MAGAQASCSGVSGATAGGLARKVAAFVGDFLSFAERQHALLPCRRAFAMPGMALDIAYAAAEYAALCDRAYVPAPAAAGQRVKLAVLDCEALPGMPRWTGAAPGFHDIAAAAEEHGLRVAYDPDHQTWDIYDPARALGVKAMHAAALRPPWEPSFPLRLLMHWAGRAAGVAMVHAGTLGHDGRGVFLVGAGGSGKSGTTLTGIMGGLSSVGDDYVAVSAHAGAVAALPVLRQMKQDLAGLRRLGLAPGTSGLAATPNWQGKIELDFDALAPGARAERLAMTAILMPHIAKAPRSSFRPASAREAMLAMAPSSLYQLHGSWREDFGLLASLVRALPAFHLDLGEDPAEIASAIRTFIERSAR